MAKRDVLDETMAKKFAWRMTAPADLTKKAAEPAPPAAAPEQQAAAEQARQRGEEASRERDELALQTVRVWQIPSPALQADGTLGLLRRVQSLGLYIAGMSNHPREALLLWRLVVRHHDELAAYDCKDAIHTMGFMPVDTDLREAAELLIEVAEKGDSWLAFMMEIGNVATDAAVRRHTDLVARFALILDEGKAWASREIAARWLALSESRAAIPSLHRAIFLPHARIRWTALEALLEMDPPAVTEADVLWLLEDAVKHPMPVDHAGQSYETAYYYGNALVTAVGQLPPPEGFRPLEIILEGNSEYPTKNDAGLDDSWALRALAAGYPERALDRIDRLLYTSKSWRRCNAVAAIELLSDELARPRLLEAATRPGHLASEQAKANWFERFAEACPVSELAGVDVELLAGPPSERFLSCLAVLRGSSDDAKRTMLKALLAEAKASEVGDGEAPPEVLDASERETLALLLFAQSDHLPGGSEPPTSEQQWATHLLRRFGDPAFEGLLKLAGRAARAGVDHEWMGALSDLAREKRLSPSQRDRLRDVAAEALCSPGWNGAISPLVALKYVGAPPDLLERLWAIALSEVPETMKARSLFSYATHWASEALIGMTDAPALDARLAEEGEKALSSRDYERLERIITIGCRRRVPRVLELAPRCLAAFDEDPAAREVAHLAAYSLEEAKLVDDGWMLGLLSKPEAPMFYVATCLVRKQPLPAFVAALEAALESRSRSGVAAAEAAEALVAMDLIKPDDARLAGIIDRAPVRERASLVGLLLRSGAPIEGLRQHVIDLLIHGDEKEPALAMLLDDLDLGPDKPPEARKLLETVLSLSPPLSIRKGIEGLLDIPSEADLYFQDTDDEEDEEGESEGEGEEGEEDEEGEEGEGEGDSS